MKTTFVFTFFLFLAPTLAQVSLIGEYELTDRTILNKTYMLNFAEVDHPLDPIMSDELFYTAKNGSSRPTCAGTFLSSKDYVYLNTEDFSGNTLSFSFWFYPGLKQSDTPDRGYIWAFTEGFWLQTPLYILQEGKSLEFGAAIFNETDPQKVVIDGYENDQWYMLIITLENDIKNNKTTFKVYDPKALDAPIVNLVYPARKSFSNMWVNLGNFNKYTTGFSGFVYSLNVWDSVIDKNAMITLFSKECDGDCAYCPNSGNCLNLHCLYPVGVHEFDPIKLCDDSCDAYCYSESKNDAVGSTPDSSCSKCFDPDKTPDPQEGCNCPVDTSPVYIRGEIIGCTPCGDGCKQCDTDGATPVCEECADPAASIDGAGCKCPKDYHTTDDSLGFCVMNCAKECDSCADGEPSYCYSCTNSLATASHGICDCKIGYFSTNTTDEPLACAECDKKCADCDKAPDYCTACDEEGKAAFDGECVCDHGFYPVISLIEGKNVTICKGCSDICEKCDKDCFMCTDIDNPSEEDKCFTSSLGYQLKYKNGIITVKFSQELDKELGKNDFNVKDKSGVWRDVTNWDIYMVSLSEYKIYSDLEKKDMPAEVSFTFEKVKKTDL